MTTVEYGTTRAGLDHSIVYTQKKFDLIFSGNGTVDDSPDLDIYLLREDGESQAFYVPDNSVIQVNWRGVVYDFPNDVYEEFYEAGGLIIREKDDQIDYIGGVIDSGTSVSIIPTPNTTVEGLELVVSAKAGTGDTLVGVVMVAECTCLNGYTFKQVTPEAATAALTSAE